MSRQESEEPGGRLPAPGGLRLVQEFVNTNDIEGGTDALATPDALQAWLRSRGLLPRGGRVSRPDVHRVVAFREAVRSLASANTGARIDPAALRLLNDTSAKVRIRFGPAGDARLDPDQGGVPGFLSHVSSLIHNAMLDGSWSRMKVCRRDVCQWLFYDHSRNNSSTWCAMAVCGNRAKTRRYYQRRHGVRGG
ncbi:MAG TPA: ABATE domain-containing protein [Actinomycetota bacterium]|nr:ABATE domain-containing protein [Actinomycetota bacterium]